MAKMINDHSSNNNSNSNNSTSTSKRDDQWEAWWDMLALAPMQYQSPNSLFRGLDFTL